MIRVTVIPISIIILILSVNYSYQDVLAMHDSQLDVNTGLLTITLLNFIL
jgi:hypothetical protein